MLQNDTRKFFGATLLLVGACGGGSAPATEAELDSGATTLEMDADSAHDAASLRDGASLRDAASAVDGGSTRDAAPGNGDASVSQADAAQPVQGSPDAGGSQTLPNQSAACTVTALSASCKTRSVELVGASSDQRHVYWALPTKAAPAAGYPAVILYQGTGVGPALTWDTPVATSAGFGGYYQVALIAELLDRGYAVIQPEASGGTYWTTNSGGNYDTSLDGVFIPLLLSALQSGTFGELDESRLYATGISSGGYMTSRMAVSYPGRFRALAIESGSYATCLGPLCNIPAQLPKDHPPTLMLHGGADTIVPISTARDYETKLMNNGIETKFVEDQSAGHQWLSTAPQDVSDWFDAH